MEQARAVADAVLFEGYLLYPYRASAAKNQMRWQFGVLAPPGAPEPCSAQTECLIEPGEASALDLQVRFLQVRSRSGERAWDEGSVREVNASVKLGDVDREVEIGFEIPGGEESEGGVVRRARPLSGVIRLSAQRCATAHRLTRVRIVVENRTSWDDPSGTRQQMLRHSLISAHTLLAIRGGAFVSLLEPPEWAVSAAKSCRNVRTWPVLVGREGQRDLMLSSPIVMYDYPAVAAQSPGDLFDATEIDEILTLRTMTLTDEEKVEARATDERAAAIIDRAEHLPPEVRERLHGGVRSLRAATSEPTVQDDPGCPEPDTLSVPGGRVAKGSKVRLRPGVRKADAQDMFLAGMVATVEAVRFGVDGSGYLAVTLDDDPAAELHRWYGRFHYFSPDEVEVEGGGRVPGLGRSAYDTTMRSAHRRG